jgi:ABC-type branched-subunit amino acid transport system substrate-binding protein
MKSLIDARTAETQNVVLFAPLTGLPAAQRQVRTMRASYADEAKSLVHHFTNLGLTSFCVVVTPGEEQKASLAAVRQAIAAIGRKPACEVALAEIGGDARATAKAVQAARPQAVFLLGDTSVAGSFIREFPFKKLGITVGALSLVNNTALLEIAGPEAARGVVITQVVPSPQKESVPVVREHVRAMKKFRDEPPSQLTLEGFIAAKTMVEALRRSLSAKVVRREDVSAALVALPEAGMTELLNQYASGSGGGSARLIEVTMMGRDGILIQ